MPEQSSQRLLRPDWISSTGILDREGQSGGQAALPWLTVTVGTDKRSSGMAAVAHLPSGGRYSNTKAIVEARWADHPQSIEECVRVAIRGLQAYLEECGLPPE